MTQNKIILIMRNVKKRFIIALFLLLGGIVWGQEELGKWYLPPYPDWVQDTINYYDDNGKHLSSVVVWGINAPNVSTEYKEVWRYINKNNVEVYLYIGLQKVRPARVSTQRGVTGGGIVGSQTDFGLEPAWKKYVFTRN